MIDKNKLRKLADVMINYSVALKKGEKIVLRGYGFESYPLIKELYAEAVRVGALKVDVRFSRDELSKVFFENASEEQLRYSDPVDEKVAENYDAMIQVVAHENRYELAGVPSEKLQIRSRANKNLSDILHLKRWCLFYYPTASSAANAKQNLEDWEDFVMDSCLLDWKALEDLENKFIDLMKEVSEVRIVGKETDLTLSIDGQKWKTCCGKRNLPDGEIFTGPVRDSVNGVILYNTPSHYRGQDFDWVKLWIEDGKVVKEDSNNVKALREILDSDEGSRFFGEFAFGLNNNVSEPTRMILFDEKMGRSLHMALGKCYEECPNGNDSIVHWDLIFRFKEADAELFFDGVKVFYDGKWVDDRFLFLN